MELGQFLLIYFASALVCGFIGCFIGSIRGSGRTGFALGFFAGPLGWLISFFVDQRPQCPACLGRVNTGATKCMHCGSDLNRA